MATHSFTASPRDLLFLRDARPMEASDPGLGANWPRPDQLWYGLIHAFHRQWPVRQTWEGPAHTKRTNERAESSDRFGALRAIGPFPVRAGVPFLPTPLDWDQQLVPCGDTNLPAPLKYAFRAKRLGKTAFPEWISAADYAAYLDDRQPLPPLEDPKLYAADRNIGIAMDPSTGATVDGKLYQAEYLRLDKDVDLAFQAACDLKPKGGGAEIDAFALPDVPGELIVGGQQGVVRLAKTPELALVPALPPITTPRLRWTLLAPAVFAHGWLPGWCVDSRKGPEHEKQPRGTVMLPDASATLVAARVGKPVAFSGWDLQQDGAPKPTSLAVPAGSCFVFDCGTLESAQRLADALHGRCRSDRLGEKGFGLGVCSSLPVPNLKSQISNLKS